MTDTIAEKGTSMTDTPTRADAFHVMPINDLRDHEDGESCWCNPWRLNDEPDVIIHNSMDGREFTIEKGKVQ